MRNGSISFKLGTAVAAFGIVFSSAASAAPVGLASVDPLVSLSVFGTASSRAAVCAAGAGAAAATAATTAATTAVAQGPAPGCVLPVLDAAPPPMIEGPVTLAPAVRGGINPLLWLVGIAALGGLAIWLLEKAGDDDHISPS